MQKGVLFLTSFAQFAEPVATTLADLRERTRPLSVFTAFHGHFLSTFVVFRSGIYADTFWLFNQQTCALDFS